jgi:hypothetical protein
MPNKRAEGQKLLTLPASEEFIRTIDQNLPKTGYSNRSQFIEKLERAGVQMPAELALAPQRVPVVPVPSSTKIRERVLAAGKEVNLRIRASRKPSI